MDNDWPIPAQQPPGAPAGGVPTGARCGTHPERAASYTCERCGNFLCFECTRLTETGEVFCASCEPKAPSTIPWERRKELGIPRAFWETLKETLTSPATFFARPPREESIWPTLAYGYFFSFVGSVISFVHTLIIGTADVQAELARTPELASLGWLAEPAFQVVALILSPLLYLLTTYFWAGMWWLGLKTVGAVHRPFHRIVRALAYCYPVTLLGALQILGEVVGLLGSLVMLFWLAALTIVAMWKVQDTDLWRPLVAAILIVVFLFGLCCGSILVLGAAIAATLP